LFVKLISTSNQKIKNGHAHTRFKTVLQRIVSSFIICQPDFVEKSWPNRGYLNLNFGTAARI